MRPREPKYRTIAADLATKIRDGAYRPGEALPAQRELSTAYGVTLATLRQALQVLEDDGLICQRPGRGTFVAEPRVAYRLDTLRGLDEDLEAQGHRLTTEILDQDLRRASRRVAECLEAPPSGRVLRLERIRLISGRPAVHQVSWIREPAAGLLVDVDLSHLSLYSALADAGVVVDAATEILRPGVLDGATATLLRRPPGEPVFRSERLSRALDVPALLDEATILGSAMEIRARRAADGLTLEWTRPGGTPPPP